MKKRVVFLVFLVAFLPLSGQPGGVSFVLEVPEEVTAGEDFEVELFFRKGDLSLSDRWKEYIRGELQVNGTRPAGHRVHKRRR